jgi:hypothetical protein
MTRIPAERILCPIDISEFSWCGSGVFFPLPPANRRGQPASVFRYHVPKLATRPVALPARTERHNPHSIATLRRQLAVYRARSLPRCPCCLRDFL